MCGFVAVIDAAGVDAGRLNRQTDSLARRGPDDRGTWISADSRVGLGSRRLAIVDLSAKGHMPMTAADGLIAIAFNGEIYNFRPLREQLIAAGHEFYSETDTEVVLKGYIEWGHSVLDRLDGMFGFALHDARDASAHKLFVARDRAGEKPVLIHQGNGRITVASELSAIMADERVERRIDPRGLDALLALGYLPGSLSLLQRVHKLRPAHSLWIDVASREIKEECYWRPPRSQQPIPAEEAIDATYAALKASVRRQLVADVPVGVFLSGGLDSSLVTAAAAECSAHRVKTFTIAFPGGGTFDESQHALHVARHFDTEHHVLDFSGSLMNEFMFVADNIDEPIGDASLLPTSLVSRFARTKVTVALGGDGGDELFGGYSTYVMLDEYQRARRLMPGFARAAVSSIAARCPIGVSGRARLSALRDDVATAFVERSVVFNYHDRQSLLAPEVTRHLQIEREPEEWRRNLWPADSESMQQAAMQVDFLSYLPDDILTKVDRASMLHSLEVRAPFLGREMMELAFGRLPTSAKVAGGRTKVLLKQLARRVLPSTLDIERKQGFSVPGALFRSPEWSQLARDSLAALPREWFDAAAVERLSQRIQSTPGAGGHAFPLVLLSRWQKKWNIS